MSASPQASSLAQSGHEDETEGTSSSHGAHSVPSRDVHKSLAPEVLVEIAAYPRLVAARPTMVDTLPYASVVGSVDAVQVTPSSEA